MSEGPTTDESPQTGTVVQGSSLLANRFEVLKVLGAGSSSRVCLVHDQKTNRNVALKLLVNRQAFEETTIDRFIEEFEICQSISHPNIIQTYDLVEFDESIAFTVEYVDGEDLGKIIGTRQFSYEDIDHIFDQLLSALEEMHSRHIVHRDIKPENLILCADNTLKVVDLGLMKRMDRPGLTRTGVVLGTAQYMPPEYIREGLHDERGDIYATGMVLYELVTGKRRLRSRPASEIFELLQRTDFEIPALALTGIPKKYTAIITKALTINPKFRYQTAAEMRAAFSGKGTSVKVEAGEELTPRIEIGNVVAQAIPKAQQRRDATTFPKGLAVVLSFVFFASCAVAYWLIHRH